MKVYKIEIENYWLLKNYSMDLEKVLSLVFGKNNTGKTSILSVLNKFLNPSERNKFNFDDFNIDFKKELKSRVESEVAITEDDYKRLGIRLRLFIKYTETDNLSNISRVMMVQKAFSKERKRYSTFAVHELKRTWQFSIIILVNKWWLRLSNGSAMKILYLFNSKIRMSKRKIIPLLHSHTHCQAEQANA